VVHVSWFAARAYCQERGARLPTENEWELASTATETELDGRNDPIWKKRVLDWYAQPTPKVLPEVGKTPPNYWGVFDLHGLVWEWVDDFNSVLVAVDTRESGDAEKGRFCGSGALAASDKVDYASFMRIAFLSSLKAHYTTGNLGFRCAKDIAKDIKG
jgi:formylglycine-generating enzyme required for sulfatase activity